MMHPKAFISYSHDSEAHKNRVFNLSEQLRADGIDCHIDQYEIAPPEGWARWTRDQIRQADFVLVVCTVTYERRYEGTEVAGRGGGAKWEGSIITQQLYESEGRNSKFIPVVFSAQDTAHIPLELRQGTFHIVDSERGYVGENVSDVHGRGRGGISHLDAGLLENAVEGGYGSRLQVKDSPFPQLFAALKADASEFLEAARLYAVFHLILTSTVERIHRLDLRMQGRSKLAVKFEGLRAARYSNQPPDVIKVDGTCDLVR